MSSPGNQRAGDATRDTTLLPSITINSSENATPLTNGTTLNSPDGSAFTTTDNFDIVEEARKFLRVCSDNEVNQALTYEQCKAVFDNNRGFVEVCCAFHKMGVDFPTKKFGHGTFCKLALADPKDRLQQYPDYD